MPEEKPTHTTHTPPPAAPPEEKKREIPEAEKEQMKRDAFSYYLRTDFRSPEIREVIEEAIADIDKKARGGSEKHEHATTENKPKTK